MELDTFRPLNTVPKKQAFRPGSYSLGGEEASGSTLLRQRTSPMGYSRVPPAGRR